MIIDVDTPGLLSFDSALHWWNDQQAVSHNFCKCWHFGAMLTQCHGQFPLMLTLTYSFDNIDLTGSQWYVAPGIGLAQFISQLDLVANNQGRQGLPYRFWLILWTNQEHWKLSLSHSSWYILRDRWLQEKSRQCANAILCSTSMSQSMRVGEYCGVLILCSLLTVMCLDTIFTTGMLHGTLATA